MTSQIIEYLSNCFLRKANRKERKKERKNGTLEIVKMSLHW